MSKEGKPTDKYLARFITGLEDAGIRFEDLNIIWKYAGGDTDSHLIKFRKMYGDRELPKHEDYCLCGHDIIRNCYITNGERFEVIGSCCIKRFEISTDLRCNNCGAGHQNRKDNLCKSCRKISNGFKICTNCPKYHKNTHKLCNACKVLCPVCKNYHPNTDHNICITCRKICTKCKSIHGNVDIDLCGQCATKCPICGTYHTDEKSPFCEKCRKECSNCGATHTNSVSLCDKCKHLCPKCSNDSKYKYYNLCKYCLRNYVKIPFRMKDEIKAKGAKYDSLCKLWYFINAIPGEYMSHKINTPANISPECYY